MRYTVLISFILILGIGILTGKPDLREPIDYEKEWKAVDSLDNIGLYRQALKRVNGIYTASKRDVRSSDELKALIFRLRFINVLKEDGYKEIIGELQNELDDDRLVFKSVKTSMLAELYFQYYQNNRWSLFKNRGFASSGGEDLEIWSPARFGAVIDSLYQVSLSYPDVVSAIKLDQYNGILKDSLPSGSDKSMLDLLSHRALKFYSNDDLDYSNAPIPDILFKKYLFSPPEDFLPWIKTYKSSSSFFARSFNILAALMEYHGQNSSDWELMEIDLNRLEYAYKVYLGPESDNAYLEALEDLEKGTGIDSLKAEVILAKSKFYQQRSGLYKINDGDKAKYIGDKTLAFDLASRVLELSPQKNTENQAKNIINSIKAPGLKPAFQKVVFPNRYIPVSLEYKNLSELWFWVTKVSPLTTLQTSYSNKRIKPDVFVEGNSPEFRGKFSLPDKGDFNFHRLIVNIPPLLEGNYQLLISSSSNPDSIADIVSLSYLRVSGISWMRHLQEDEKILFNIIDRGSGMTMGGIRVKQIFSKYNHGSREQEVVEGKEFFSDRDGELIISNSGFMNKNRRESFMLLFGSDENGIIIPDRYYINPEIGNQNKRPTQRIYTDRGIYRPGQEVRFSGLLVQYEKAEIEPVEKHDIEVLFQDATHKIIDTLKLRTDDSGFFRGHFEIPPDVLSGNFQIVTKYSRQSVQVEQYKRPGFNIRIDEDRRVYEPGDSIYISGQAEAFAGMKLAGAEVQIDASLNLYDKRYYRHRFSGRSIHVGSTSLDLDKQGKFSWRLKSLDFPEGTFTLAHYEFKIKVKDTNGETRESNHKIVLSNSPIKTGVQGPIKVNRREGGLWKIDIKSPGGRLVNTDINIKVARLNDPDIRELPFPLPRPDTWIIKRKTWEKHFPRISYLGVNEDDSIRSIFTSEDFTVDEGQLIFNPDIKRWGIGRYKIIISTSTNPDKIIGSHEFDIYDVNKRDYPVRDPLWIDIEKKEYQPGEKMKFFVGSRYPGMYLLEVRSLEEVILRDWIALDNFRKKMSILVEKSMLGNISISLSGIYENNFFSTGQLVKIPRKDKKLIVKGLDSLDAVTPGLDTKMDFKVTDIFGNPVSVSGVLSIYDASLDEIKPVSWRDVKWPEMNIGRKLEQANCFGTHYARLIHNPTIPYEPVKNVVYPDLNWFGLNYHGIRRYGREELAMQPAAARLKTDEQNEAQGDEEIFMIKEDVTQLVPTFFAKPPKEMAQPPVFRKDFRETAYFNSEFRTGKDGKGSIDFAVPDAITKWNIKLYAHDGSLAQVLSNADFQSRKKIMLMPNLPRFVRSGDQVELKVKVNYNDQVDRSFKTSIRIENPLDGNKLIHQDKKELEIEAGGQRIVTWTFKVPENLTLLQANFEIEGDDLHDGLSQSITVLPKVLSFWDAQNFYLNDISAVELKSGPSTERAALEINTQPIWMAVQALPVISGKEIACSEYWFSRFFTANLINHVSLANPDIRKRLDKLAAEASEDPRLNPYLRNQEIRKFSLDAGLWKGADIEEAMHIVGLTEAFNPVNNGKELKKSLEKLADLQLPDGSWPWFKGMRPDFRMTLHILGGLGELINEGSLAMEKGSVLEKMIRQAVNSVDKTVYQNYNRFKINHPDDDPPLGSNIIFYLYARSLFSEYAIQEKYQEARDYYYDKSGELWLERSITDQTFIAISHIKSGDEQIASLVFNSLMDRRIRDDKGGAFWKIDNRFRGWQERDIWQQSRVIELFNLMSEGKEHIDELKTWLLMQKRSRDWSDRISTAMAVKSLILYGSNWYSVKPEIRIKSNFEDFSSLRINTGTDKGGFYRYFWKEEDLPEERLILDIEKSGDAPVWGSLFEQSVVDIDTMHSSGTDLKIKRAFLLQKPKDGALQWVPYDGKLEAGQKIKIHLEVEADQAIDYVQIRDFRPSALEPDKSLSGYRWSRGVSWYQTQGDLYTDFYIHRLPKGKSYFEYDLFVEQVGAYSKGYAEIQSQYAPEFMAKSNGGRVEVK